MLEKLNQLIPIGNIFRNKSLQNFLFLAIIQSSNVLISIISMPLLIQNIGVDQFGLVSLSLSVIILLNIMVGFGYNLSAPREVAIHQQDKEALSHLLSNVFSGKFLLASFSALLILIGAFGFNLFKEYQMILVFSSMLLFSEATLPLWFFQGMEKMKLVSIANVFSKLLYLMGIVLFIHSPEQSRWVNFMMGFFGLGINLVLLFYIHSSLQIKFYRPQFSAIWASLRENVLFFFSNLTGYISVNGGLIIFSFFAGAETLGMYSLAERVVMVLRLFPALIVQAIYPNASKLYSQDELSFYRFLKSVYFKVLGIGAMIALATYFSAPWIIKTLSKSDLPDSVTYLQFLSPLLFLSCLNIPNITMMLVLDLKQMLFKAGWMMCVYMIVTSSVLTYFYQGIGLCIAILSTEVIAYLICMILLFTHNRKQFRAFYV
ncbi:oligosaccharide flippase family protein [Algoriphagus halophytocola]|uniref:oligosaccharide flippase family protein n=1 Tax=Algoriphagus halophytocola TaxID=2991499 RepID=UPI0022DE461E|nr:oligosaccharide flippase family protein [Algoriphagus sp. TR-M9]WBL42587.1 oligosaccharide flippase family protein [Algoriphagus sp. TR-M9]